MRGDLDNAHHDADETVYRIPGRDFYRGDITHKRWRDMNRKERRAMTSADGRRQFRWLKPTALEAQDAT